MATDDPLAKLLLDAVEVDRTLLAEALAERIGIDSKTGRLILLPGYATLRARQKVLALLLAAKAAALLRVREGELIAMQEVVAASGLPRGTVAPKLKDLRDSRLAAQGEGRAYYIPNALLPRAVSELTEE